MYKVALSSDCRDRSCWLSLSRKTCVLGSLEFKKKEYCITVLRTANRRAASTQSCFVLCWPLRRDFWYWFRNSRKLLRESQYTTLGKSLSDRDVSSCSCWLSYSVLLTFLEMFHTDLPKTIPYWLPYSLLLLSFPRDVSNWLPYRYFLLHFLRDVGGDVSC